MDKKVQDLETALYFGGRRPFVRSISTFAPAIPEADLRSSPGLAIFSGATRRQHQTTDEVVKKMPDVVEVDIVNSDFKTGD